MEKKTKEKSTAKERGNVKRPRKISYGKGNKYKDTRGRRWGEGIEKTD